MASPRIPLGPFELEHIVGTGGMGEVWKAHHIAGDATVAVKVLTDARHRDQIYLDAFQNEVRAVASLDHPGIVPLLDYGEISADAAARSAGKLQEGSPYLVMEYAQRGALNRFQRAIGWQELKVVLFSVLDALAHAHACDVMHRDLKPANILVGCGDLTPGIKLTDFGLAHAIGQDSVDELTRRGWGTPHYMAPEQFRGAWRDFGPWTDLYAFGVMAFELTVGEHPYQATTGGGFARAHTMLDPRPFIPKFEVPDGFDYWLLTLLQKAPADRFQRAADAAYALSQLGEPAGDAGTFRMIPVGSADSEQTTEPPPSLLLRRGPTVDSPEYDPGADTIADQEPSTRLLRSGTPNVATEALDFESWEEPSGPSPTILSGVSGKLERRAPPLPWTWKRPHRKRFNRALLGAGLGLFGIKTIPLVGREPDRNILWNALKEVRETRKPQAVLLSGPAGTGKSRLAEWFVRRAHEVGSAENLKATNDPVTPGSEATRRMLVRHFRCGGLSGEKLQEHLKSRIQEDAGDPEDEADALAILIDQTVHAGSDVSTSVRLRPEHRHALVRRQLARASRARPSIIWIDDVQWGADSLMLASSLLEEEELPVLIVMTSRAEVLRERPWEHAIVRNLATRPNVRVVRLQELSQDDTRELVQELLYLSGDLANEVVKRSQGNPLFAVQLVDDWVAGGKLTVGENGFDLRPGVQVELPEDIFELWSERLDRVLTSPDEQVLLEIGAALGQQVSPHEWRDSCRNYGVPIPKGFLQRLTLAGILTVENDDWAFVHGMLRDALVRASKNGGRWASIHLACAKMLEMRYGANQYPTTERRAVHLCEAERLGSAIEPLLDAARHRLVRSEFERAEELVELRESALMEVGVDPDRPSWGEGWLMRSRVMLEQGEFSKSHDMAERVFIEARRYAWETLIGQSLLLQGLAEQESGRLDRALRLFERAEEEFSEVSDRKGAARAIEGRARVAQYRGDAKLSNELFRTALDVYDALDDTLGTSRCINGLGDVARHSGHYHEARAFAAESMRLAESLNNQLGVADAVNDLAELDRLESQLERSEEGCRRALRLFEALGSERAMEVRVNLGQTIVGLGRYGEARQLFEEARRHGKKVRDEDLVARTNVALLAPLAFVSEWDLWRKRFDEANRLLLRLKFKDPNIASAAEAAADMARKAGRHDLADEAEALRDQQR